MYIVRGKGGDDDCVYKVLNTVMKIFHTVAHVTSNLSLLVYLSIFINMIIDGCCNKSSKKLYIGEQTIQ